MGAFPQEETVTAARLFAIGTLDAEQLVPCIPSLPGER